MSQIAAPAGGIGLHGTTQSRRGFLAGFGALLVAAPAIVRAGSLMPIAGEKFVSRPALVYSKELRTILTVRQITREAIRLFENSNEFLRDKEFFHSDAANGYNWPAKIGTTLRIRLPNDFIINQTASLA
jgi:hypothetical protein